MSKSKAVKIPSKQVIKQNIKKVPIIAVDSDEDVPLHIESESKAVKILSKPVVKQVIKQNVKKVPIKTPIIEVDSDEDVPLDIESESDEEEKNIKTISEDKNDNDDEKQIEKRKLTIEEIEYMTDYLIPQPYEKNDVVRKNLENIRKSNMDDLAKITIYPESIEDMKNYMKKAYLSSLIQPGQMVGVDSACSIGEPVTQMVLNTFHSAGSTNLTLTTGVPRLEELMHASKNQKQNSLTFKLNREYIDPKIKEKCLLKINKAETLLNKKKAECGSVSEDEKKIKLERYEKQLEEAKSDHLYEKVNAMKRQCRMIFEKKLIMDFLEGNPKVVHCQYSNLEPEDKIWYDIYDECYGTEYQKYEWGTRLVFKQSAIYQYCLDMRKIAGLIEDNSDTTVSGGFADVLCVFSPNNIGIIDVYLDTQVEDPDEFLHKLQKQKSKKKKDDEKENVFIWNDNNKYYYYVRDLLISFVKCIKISGIDGIDKIYLREDNKKEWIVETLGTNLRLVMSHPDVIFESVQSNNQWEVYKTFGIEAVRNMLIDNITFVISMGGSNLTRVHLEALVDSMICKGHISSVSRDGIGKDDAGPLTRASFEQSSDNMLSAARKGEIEDVSGVSASIILGQRSKLGSGIMDIFMNMKMLREEKFPKQPTLVTIAEEPISEAELATGEKGKRTYVNDQSEDSKRNLPENDTIGEMVEL